MPPRGTIAGSLAERGVLVQPQPSRRQRRCGRAYAGHRIMEHAPHTWRGVHTSCGSNNQAVPTSWHRFSRSRQSEGSQSRPVSLNRARAELLCSLWKATWKRSDCHADSCILHLMALAGPRTAPIGERHACTIWRGLWGPEISTTSPQQK